MEVYVKINPELNLDFILVFDIRDWIWTTPAL